MREYDLTAEEWKRTHALAKALARDVDRNEFGKVVTYFRRARDPGKMLVLLHRLPRSAFVRTNRTRGYLEKIAQAWQQHLPPDVKKERAILIASWAFRLMTYYQDKKVIDTYR